jgi:hypothetical protein
MSWRNLRCLSNPNLSQVLSLKQIQSTALTLKLHQQQPLLPAPMPEHPESQPIDSYDGRKSREPESHLPEFKFYTDRILFIQERLAEAVSQDQTFIEALQSCAAYLEESRTIKMKTRLAKLEQSYKISTAQKDRLHQLRNQFGKAAYDIEPTRTTSSSVRRGECLISGRASLPGVGRTKTSTVGQPMSSAKPVMFR